MSFELSTPIETERLLVRVVSEADLPDLLAVNGDPEVTRHLPYECWRTTADARAWYQRMASVQAQGRAVQLVLIERRSGAAIGTCLLFHFDEKDARAELGYVLGRSHWGTGLMHEALCAVIDTCFGALGLQRLEAYVDPRNQPSERLLERLRFTREGLLRRAERTSSGTHDLVIYGLLKEEWTAPAG